MRYQEVLDYLYEKLPMFQRVGPPAFKKDLTNTLTLCTRLGDPHKKFKTIHIGGTNGKGSSSHMISAILQQAGYKTGLYTSPHLKDFTERIKINGISIPESFIADFVTRYKPLIEEVEPSFFEVTVVMAFDFFAREKVDFAVFEVGLGGRLDSTNVIVPEVSLITNISYDHQDMLGDTLEKIAGEKAGIIKPGIPVVIGSNQEEVIDVFQSKARETLSLIDIATDYYEVQRKAVTNNLISCSLFSIHCGITYEFTIGAGGLYQIKNLPGVIRVVDILIEKGVRISLEHIEQGLAGFQRLTGLRGRWQVLREKPMMIADVAHNEEGIREVLRQLMSLKARKYHFVLGFVKEKDLSRIMPLFPKQGRYYFCQATVPRAMPARQLL
ncbi:MAG: bifunctional folylpolyglutamate synthase/dihydrofolate synthase, partial [Cyclobacteriaceae bacterium]|nr:bifunctional folylpolyglutamate synthase/dihydrofolate synthase [Cyclobacteriaceae bacterium]